jgi:serine-type D-Ala-D-Ala carboxypeptidase/endopeptidase (penicillin-binding protein 4)
MPKPTRRDAAQCLLAALAFLSTAAKKRSHRLSLPAAIDHEIAAPGPLASAYVGALVVRLSNGKVLYAHNEDKLFVPASNAKLFTTALALARLGPDYRFTTSIVAEGAVDPNGRLNGDLVLVGRGDPSLSGRTYPYTTEPSDNDPLQLLEQLADQVVSTGLRAVTGDIVGDDTRYPWAPYPGGWNIGDETWDYGAPVSALVVNDNRIALSIAPGDAEGDLAKIWLSPALEYLSVDNRVRTTTGPHKALHAERQAGSRQIVLWGHIGLEASPSVEQLAIPEPAFFAADALRDALQRRGVAIRGGAVARHRMLEDLVDPERGEPTPVPAATELARRMSPTLIQLLQVVDKVSQNLHAEILLHEVGAVRRNMGTVAAGSGEMREFLSEAGIAPEEVHLPDGSGLSRNTLVTPQAIVKLLVHMYRSPFRDQFLNLLPVGGEDGSLRRRFPGHPEARNIHAKTGTLGGVRALSGYAMSREYGLVAFSILINNASAENGDLTKVFDNVGLKLLL